jgi:hypothetical protein
MFAFHFNFYKFGEGMLKARPELEEELWWRLQSKGCNPATIFCYN